MKKLHLWRDHAQLLEMGLSLRCVAAALQIHLSTAFDWRHRLLAELSARDRATIAGTVQLSELWFPYSAKGSRDFTRWRRERGVPSRTLFRGPSVRVVVACGNGGAVVSGLVDVARVTLRDLLEIVGKRIVGRPLICATVGPLSPAGRFARALEAGFRQVRGFEKDELMGDVMAYSKRLKQWLRRFRGVATYYLPNYLAWHRVQEACSLRMALLDWSLSPGVGTGAALIETAHAA